MLCIRRPGSISCISGAAGEPDDLHMDNAMLLLYEHCPILAIATEVWGGRGKGGDAEEDPGKEFTAEVTCSRYGSRYCYLPLLVWNRFYQTPTVRYRTV